MHCRSIVDTLTHRSAQLCPKEANTSTPLRDQGKVPLTASLRWYHLTSTHWARIDSQLLICHKIYNYWYFRAIKRNANSFQSGRCCARRQAAKPQGTVALHCMSPSRTHAPRYLYLAGELAGYFPSDTDPFLPVLSLTQHAGLTLVTRGTAKNSHVLPLYCPHIFYTSLLSPSLSQNTILHVRPISWRIWRSPNKDGGDDGSCVGGARLVAALIIPYHLIILSASHEKQRQPPPSPSLSPRVLWGVRENVLSCSL